MTANGKRLRTIGILMARGGGNARVDADGRIWTRPRGTESKYEIKWKKKPVHDEVRSRH